MAPARYKRIESASYGVMPVDARIPAIRLSNAIEWTWADVLNGRDADLEAALEEAGKQMLR